MKCYFDNYKQVNLNSVNQIDTIRSFQDFEFRYSHANLNFTYSTDYDSRGIYFVEVSTHAHLWCSSNHHKNSFNLIESIPRHVIDAVQLKKIRIIIIAVVEGDNFNKSDDINVFTALTTAIRSIGLPQHSVLIISGNVNANTQYMEWCNHFNEIPWIEFSEGIDWTGQTNWHKQIDPIFSKSITDAKFLYNSLNRSHRHHRSEHLYMLAQTDVLDRGLVSGGIWFNKYRLNIFDPIKDPQYIENISKSNYTTLLRKHYPRTVDSTVESLQTNNLAGTSNLDIFKDSLLTLSTESHFDDNQGLFITEKTFRPIAMGHPFIVLGQPNLLKKLQSFGFKTDFIDTSYDEILDNKKRFAKFHESFLNWINDDKEKYFAKWQLYVEHNLYVYQHTNFKKLYIEDAIERTTRYFKESS
jgi:hypothetical protein